MNTKLFFKTLNYIREKLNNDCVVDGSMGGIEHNEEDGRNGKHFVFFEKQFGIALSILIRLSAPYVDKSPYYDAGAFRTNVIPYLVTDIFGDEIWCSDDNDYNVGTSKRFNLGSQTSFIHAYTGKEDLGNEGYASLMEEFHKDLLYDIDYYVSSLESLLLVIEQY